MGKLSKKERKAAFKGLNGWFSNKATFEYADPDKGLQKLDHYNFLKLTYIDPKMDHALYKCMQITPNDQINTIAPVATIAVINTVNNYTISLQGAVASYDRNHGQIRLELVDMDDKSTWKCKGDGEKFRGISTEFSLNSALPNDEAFGGGYIAAFRLKKLNKAPKGLENLDFAATYKKQFNAIYKTT